MHTTRAQVDTTTSRFTFARPLQRQNVALQQVRGQAKADAVISTYALVAFQQAKGQVTVDVVMSTYTQVIFQQVKVGQSRM